MSCAPYYQPSIEIPLSRAISDIGSEFNNHNPAAFTSEPRSPLPAFRGTYIPQQSPLLWHTAFLDGASYVLRPSSNGPWNPFHATFDDDNQRTVDGTSFMAYQKLELFPEDELHHLPREITSIFDGADNADEADEEAIDKPPSGDPIGPPSPTMISDQNELNQVSRIKNNGGRQGKLDIKTAEKAKEMRKYRACWNCKLNKYEV